MPSPSTFWSCLDAVVVINLDHRADRWAQIREHLATLAPMDKVHRLSAVRGVDLPGYGDKRWFRRTKRQSTWAGRAGITLSQRNAMRLMLEKGWRRILILEDDARFTAPVDTASGDALAGAWTAAGDAPSACFLGFTEPRGPASRVLDLGGGNGLFRIGGCLCAHAYVVNATAAAALLEGLPQRDGDVWAWLARHSAVDTWYALHMARRFPVFAVSPAWVEQEDSHSDIVQRASGGTQAPDLATVKDSALDAALARWAGAPGRWLKWMLRLVRGF